MSNYKGKPETLDAANAERLKTRLKFARHMQNKTIKQLAESVGCSESLLSKIENGVAYPSLLTLIRLVNVLNISIDWIFDDNDHDFSLENATAP